MRLILLISQNVTQQFDRRGAREMEGWLLRRLRTLVTSPLHFRTAAASFTSVGTQWEAVLFRISSENPMISAPTAPRHTAPTAAGVGYRRRWPGMTRQQPVAGGAPSKASSRPVRARITGSACCPHRLPGGRSSERVRAPRAALGPAPPSCPGSWRRTAPRPPLRTGPPGRRAASSGPAAERRTGR